MRTTALCDLVGKQDGKTYRAKLDVVLKPVHVDEETAPVSDIVQRSSLRRTKEFQMGITRDYRTSSTETRPVYECQAGDCTAVGCNQRGEMEELVKQYSGQGSLIFDDGITARVTYHISEYQDFLPDGLGGTIPGLKDRRGRVSRAEGHPNWHPIVSLYDRPSTLVMNDGRKLKVFLKTSDGAVQCSGDFFLSIVGDWGDAEKR